MGGKVEGSVPRRVDGLAALSDVWGFLLGLGIGLMILGAAAIGSSFVATLATILVFAILLVLGGIFQVVSALWGRSWRGFFLHLLTGVLYLITGVFMLDSPAEAALGITLLVAAGLLVAGVLRIVLALVERFAGWGWALLNGVISLSLGAAIWRQWPLSGLWVIGLFVGIEMLSSGLAWVTLALAVRSAPQSAIPA